MDGFVSVSHCDGVIHTVVIAHILNNVLCNVLKIKNNNNKKGIKSRSHQIIKYTHTINKSSLKNPNI